MALNLSSGFAGTVGVGGRVLPDEIPHIILMIKGCLMAAESFSTMAGACAHNSSVRGSSLGFTGHPGRFSGWPEVFALHVSVQVYILRH